MLLSFLCFAPLSTSLLYQKKTFDYYSFNELRIGFINKKKKNKIKISQRFPLCYSIHIMMSTYFVCLMILDSLSMFILKSNSIQTTKNIGCKYSQSLFNPKLRCLIFFFKKKNRMMLSDAIKLFFFICTTIVCKANFSF